MTRGLRLLAALAATATIASGAACSSDDATEPTRSTITRTMTHTSTPPPPPQTTTVTATTSVTEVVPAGPFPGDYCTLSQVATYANGLRCTYMGANASPRWVTVAPGATEGQGG